MAFMSSQNLLAITSTLTEGSNSFESYRDSGTESTPSSISEPDLDAIAVGKDTARSQTGNYIHVTPGTTDLEVRESSQGTTRAPTQCLSSRGVDENTNSQVIIDDPFDNKKRRILFDAINKLQAWRSHKYLDIPQLVVVGEESAGKSSLLKSLTEIPFPISSECCTRFPIRVISRRTAQGTAESFSIRVERAPHDVVGLQRADPKADDYKLEGSVLTMSEFESALEDLSENYIGIRKGSGKLKKNFVPDIVRVELSGPNRSLFNILDLPGLVYSQFNINGPEYLGTQELARQYISKPGNTVICIIPATSRLSTQQVFQLCKDHVTDKRQLIGVFTKCDQVTIQEEKEKVVSSAKGNAEESGTIFRSGMFVVCNTVAFDVGSSTIARRTEQDFFHREPWFQIPAERRGSSKLKDYLGDILTSQIEQAFPKLERNIQTQLSEKLLQRATLGEPRTERSQRQAYINQFVRRYSKQATSALRRPGPLASDGMDLRQQLKTLNHQFDNVMRWAGGSWAFEDADTDPLTVCMNYTVIIDDPELDKKAKDQKANEALYPAPVQSDYTIKLKDKLKDIPAFEEYKEVKTPEEFHDEMKQWLDRFGATQPPGVVNSDIYPVIYRLQVSKWGLMAQEHLERIKDAIKSSYEGILGLTCPDSGSTSILHRELKERLHSMFNHTLEKARRELEFYCKKETERQFLLTTNPEYSSQLGGWRQLRYARAFHQGSGGDEAHDLATSERLDQMWSTMDLSNQHRMMCDIHDVVKVYYKISLESFIRHITQTIVESFVMDQDGPLSKLTSEYVLDLSEKEICKMSREDNNTAETREELEKEICKLEGARKIAQDARDEVEAFKTA